MKTMVFLLICASGLIWPSLVNNLHRGGVTVIYKTPGPMVKISKTQVIQWSI